MRRVVIPAAIAGAFLLTLIVGIVTGCGSDSATNPTYVTTGSKGDLATWSFSGTSLTIQWKKTDTTGAVAKTINATAVCGAADATFGALRCAINLGATCTNGTATCGPGDAPAAGDVFYPVEAPGIGLMVLPADHSQLFVGIIAGDCAASVDGDYTWINTGVGQQDIFGMYRLTGGFASVVHSDFKFVSTHMGGGGAINDRTIAYSTGDGAGSGALALTTSSCTNGVRTLTTPGGEIVSATLTSNGMFIIDKPSGQGGLVSFKSSNAATVADLTGITMRGFAFPDNSGPQPLAVTTTAGTATSVTTSVQFGTVDASGITAGATQTGSLVAAASQTSNPDFTAVPNNAPNAYTANSLHLTYAAPSNVPGIFFSPPQAGDTGAAILGAMKVNGKILAFGAVFNDRTMGISGAHMVNSTTALPNTGNFIAFQQ